MCSFLKIHPYIYSHSRIQRLQFISPPPYTSTDLKYQSNSSTYIYYIVILYYSTVHRSRNTSSIPANNPTQHSAKILSPIYIYTSLLYLYPFLSLSLSLSLTSKHHHHRRGNARRRSTPERRLHSIAALLLLCLADKQPGPERERESSPRRARARVYFARR